MAISKGISCPLIWVHDKAVLRTDGILLHVRVTLSSTETYLSPSFPQLPSSTVLLLAPFLSLSLSLSLSVSFFALLLYGFPSGSVAPSVGSSTKGSFSGQLTFGYYADIYFSRSDHNVQFLFSLQFFTLCTMPSVGSIAINWVPQMGGNLNGGHYSARSER